MSPVMTSTPFSPLESTMHPSHQQLRSLRFSFSLLSTSLTREQGEDPDTPLVSLDTERLSHVTQRVNRLIAQLSEDAPEPSADDKLLIDLRIVRDTLEAMHNGCQTEGCDAPYAITAVSHEEWQRTKAFVARITQLDEPVTN